jgi:hypothetical protein
VKARHTLLILALWRLRQEDLELKASLGYTARSYLQKKRMEINFFSFLFKKKLHNQL